MKTRERILATSLDLFNLCGEPNISTVDIANEMNISPGNLYYHFRNKEEIVKSIFDKFEYDLSAILDIQPDSFSNILEIWLYFKLVYEKLWEFRFIFRDLNNLIGKTQFMQKHILRLMKRETDTVHIVCEALKAAGELSIAEQQINNLVDNMVFKMMFWINYAYTLNRKETDEATVKWGVFQLVSLLEPHLTQASTDVLRELNMGDFV